VILVRPDTSPDDFHGMVTSRAILTARGRHDVARRGGGPRDGQAVHRRRAGSADR
jgi:hypothetical protein